MLKDFKVERIDLKVNLAVVAAGVSFKKTDEDTDLKVADVELSFEDDDRDAAWELYIEMLTRVTTQALPSEEGDEQTALDSVYSLFPTTREILRRRGRKTIEFSKVAIPVLNQVVRPFTAKWHKESLAGAFTYEADKQREFRDELGKFAGDVAKLQPYIGIYCQSGRLDRPRENRGGLGKQCQNRSGTSSSAIYTRTIGALIKSKAS